MGDARTGRPFCKRYALCSCKSISTEVSARKNKAAQKNSVSPGITLIRLLNPRAAPKSQVAVLIFPNEPRPRRSSKPAVELLEPVVLAVSALEPTAALPSSVLFRSTPGQRPRSGCPDCLQPGQSHLPQYLHRGKCFRRAHDHQRRC